MTCAPFAGGSALFMGISEQKTPFICLHKTPLEPRLVTPLSFMARILRSNSYTNNDSSRTQCDVGITSGVFTRSFAMTEQMPNGYSPRLYNQDLGPLPQKWNWYNIFAFWMSDVHSVGGYVFAASLFALGLASWQVLIALLGGICIVQLIANLVARPSQQAAVPYPVICRLAFGVFGANIPAVIRGLIAVAWYGIQTYLASSALIIVVLRFFPSMATYAEPHFAGLSYLGWFGFLSLWFVQALVFWAGMESIRRFIDWAGPVVYGVMFMLAGWIVWQAGWSNISFTLAEKSLSGWEAFGQVIVAMALVVSYFSGPTLNFGDFSRYCRSMKDVRRGNFWGLPVNFLAFSW